MTAVCHEIKETERCKCGEHYEQWGRRPAPPCFKCHGTEVHAKKASPGETGIEQGGSEGNRAKRESSDGRDEKKKLTSDTFSSINYTVRGYIY